MCNNYVYFYLKQYKFNISVNYKRNTVVANRDYYIKRNSSVAGLRHFKIFP